MLLTYRSRSGRQHIVLCVHNRTAFGATGETVCMYSSAAFSHPSRAHNQIAQSPTTGRLSFRTGRTLRDLPEHFGSRTPSSKDVLDLVKADVLVSLFKLVTVEPDMQYAMVDASSVRLHRHGQGAKKCGLRARP